MWGKETGVGVNEDDEGTPSPSSPLPFPQVVNNNNGEGARRRGGSSGCDQRVGAGRGRVIRRGRPNALRVRATASVIGELARRVHRFERGEGGGVT